MFTAWYGLCPYNITQIRLVSKGLIIIKHGIKHGKATKQIK
jgi:hypothetical protein